MDIWQGRVDAEEGEGGLRLHQIIKTHRDENIALLGFACDAGVIRNRGRAGAKDGPDALRRALAALPAEKTLSIGDAGNITCEGDALETAQEAFTQQAASLLARGILPIGLGGGHEIAYASGMALKRAFPDARLGIINIDAHLDVRIDRRPSSGTPFRQLADNFPYRYACLGASRFANTASLFARATQMGAWVVEDSHLPARDWAHTAEEINAFCQSVDALYLTLDLDCLPASVMPAVSAPAAMGLPVHLVENLIAQIFASGKVRLCDVAEYNPRFDIDARGARTAARLIMGMILHSAGNNTFLP